MEDFERNEAPAETPVTEEPAADNNPQNEAPKKTYYYSNQGNNTFEPEPTPPPKKSNDDGLAITSLVLGILGLCCCGLPTGIASIICAIVDRNRRGRFEGLGLAGFICGVIACVLSVISSIYSMVVFGSLFSDLESFLTEPTGGILSLFRLF